MKVALIGASGFVGSQILKELLSKGHDVTAIVRNPEKVTTTNPHLKVKKGDVLNENEVPRLTEGNDAVISSYNPGWTNPDIYNQTLQAYGSIVNGVKKARVKRLLIVGGGGSLYASPGGVQLVDTPSFPQEWKPGAMGLRDVLTMLRNEKDLEWTFFSPAVVLEPGEPTGNFRLGRDEPVMNEKGESRISVGDYAAAMVNELENPSHIRKRFTIGY